MTSDDHAPDAARDELWQPFASSLPRDAQVLELVPPMASMPTALQQVASAAHVTATALAPGWNTALGDAMFDAAAGEFVFTECDVGDVLSSLLPLLAPGSELQFVVHHPESLAMAHAIATGVEADYLFARNRAFAAIQSLFSLPANAPAQTVQAAGQSLHQSIAQLRQAAQSGQSQGHGAFLQAALDAVGSLLATYRATPGAAVAGEARKAERQLRGYADHMQSVRANAVDAEGMERIAEQARMLGYTRVEFEPALQEGETFGWLMLLHRP